MIGVAGTDEHPIVSPEAFCADAAGPALPGGAVHLRREDIELDFLSCGVGVEGYPGEFLRGWRDPLGIENGRGQRALR